MIFKNGFVFIEDKFYKVSFEVNNGYITRIQHNTDEDVHDTKDNKIDNLKYNTNNNLNININNNSNFIDLDENLVLPGLIDIHTHGCIGYDFGDATTSQMKTMEQFYLKNGITTVVPTIVTLHKDKYNTQINNIVNCYNNLSPYIGINLEGPFISKLKRGSHNINNIIDIDLDLIKEWWTNSKHTIKLITVDPEKKNFDKLYDYSKNKFNISLGHTNCYYTEAQKAINMGVNNITHLFNAMNGLHHRKPSLIDASLEYPVFKELICDGIHVDDVLLKILFNKYKDELVIISDSLSACGLNEGKYILGGLEVIVKNNTATLHDGTIAGSINSILDNIKHLNSIGININNIIKSATIIPAKAINEDKLIGSIEVGKRANFIVCDSKFNIISTYKNGINVIDNY